jgi:hypothetical protein
LGGVYRDHQKEREETQEQQKNRNPLLLSIAIFFPSRPLQAVLATLDTISVFSAAVEVLVRCDLYPEPASIVNLFFIAANSLY